MQVQELFYPQVVARLGDYTFQRGITVEAYSSREKCCDWAKVQFTEDIFQPKISLEKMDPAVIAFGYGGVMDDTFVGYVAKPYNNGNGADEITLKDDMIRLEGVTVNATFQDTTPQEVIAYLLAQAGVANMELSQESYPARARVSIRQATAVQAIRQVHSAWGIAVPFYFSEGTFYWGVDPKQDKIYTFEYGVNILTLIRSGGIWELETVSAPFVRHSQKIQIEHPKVRGEYTVRSVRTITNEDGFIRTYISF